MTGAGTATDRVSTLADRRALGRLLLWTLPAWILALALHPALASVAKLAALADAPNPYFVPSHGLLLYIAAPLAVLAAGVLFLSPGLFLAAAWNGASSSGRWLVYGMGVSLVLVSVAAGVAQAMVPRPLAGLGFAALVVATSVIAFGILWWRTSTGKVRLWPRGRGAFVTMGLAAVVPLVLLIVLAPKFYWENFTSDAVHTLESTRLLYSQALPFWPETAGGMVAWPGLNTMLFLFPTSWFVRLFGETEAAIRVPALLWLAVLFVALVDVARGEKRRLGGIDQGLVWLGLVVYAIVLFFSATYNPYSADIALPAAQDTLQIVLFLGFVLAFQDGRVGWMLLFIALNIVSLPSGPLLIALWLGVTVLVFRPRPWRAVVGAGLGLGAMVAIVGLIPSVLAQLGVPTPGQEHATGNLLTRLRFLQWRDWQRVLFVVVPAGILPALLLVGWRRLDPLGRALGLVTLGYFLVFYIQRWTLLHYYAPAMVLPLAAHWHSDLWSQPRLARWLRPGLALGCLVAVVVSWPRTVLPDTLSRRVGRTMDIRLDGYENVSPVYYRQLKVLEELFPRPGERNVPHQSYGGASTVWNYYARGRGAAGPPWNYVLQREDEPPPPGTHRVADLDGVALYVLSDSIWAQHRALRPRGPVGSALYEIRR